MTKSYGDDDWSIDIDFPREIAVHRKEVAIEIANSGPAIAGKIRPATNE